VHSAECSNVRDLLYNPDREIEVEWASTKDGVFPVSLLIETEDKPGILAKLTEAIAKYGGNIRQFEAQTIEVGRGLIEVIVEVSNRKQLEKLSESLLAVKGVLGVSRRRESGRRASGRQRRVDG
jgi:guanosine-3',5'-bis(diphosphate) 3'-pyrophosphohydrolase